MPNSSSYRSLALIAAVLGSALSASAQFVDLVTEAPVTIQVTMQSTVTAITTTAATRTAPATTSRKTTTKSTRLTNLQVLQELVAEGIIPGNSAIGWSLVAVRDAPADLAFVDAGFNLYAVKGTTRVAVPKSKFEVTALGVVAKYVERHQGRYVYSSKGTVTNHASYAYTPAYRVGSSDYVVTESASDGFAKVNFVTKDFSDGHEVFFYAINSASVTSKGGFSGTVTVGEGDPEPTSGLFSISVSVGAAKLVPASLYPDVATFLVNEYEWVY